MRAPRSSTHSSSAIAASGSASESIGTPKMRSWWAKPQSSSSHWLNAWSTTFVASMSSRSICSMPTASVGNRTTAVEALLVHHRHARVAVLVLGAQRLELHERPRVDALGDLAAEHEVHAARPR